MIVYLVRHGETAANRDGVGLGRGDLPLTRFGEQQADALGARLADTPIDRIVSSPLGRAIQTAECIAGERGVAIEVRDELTELDVGETEGMSFAEMGQRFGGFLAKWRSDDCASARMPGGESLEDVAARLEPFTQWLRAGGDETVAVVSHNFTLRVLLCQLMGTGLQHFRAMPLGLASLSTLRIDRGRLSIVALNSRCHIDRLELSGGSS